MKTKELFSLTIIGVLWFSCGGIHGDDLAESNPEFEKLLVAFPQLGNVLKPKDVIWNWIAMHFLNTNGERIYLPLKKSISDFAADQPVLSLSYRAFNGGLYIIVGKTIPNSKFPVSGEQALVCVVFEIYNLEQVDEFQKLYSLVASKLIGVDAFTKACANLEVHTGQKVQMFYQNLYLPYALRNNMPHDEDNWTFPASVNGTLTPQYRAFYKSTYDRFSDPNVKKAFHIHELNTQSGHFKITTLYSDLPTVFPYPPGNPNFDGETN